jgi:hypothetical protein
MYHLLDETSQVQWWLENAKERQSIKETQLCEWCGMKDQNKTNLGLTLRRNQLDFTQQP